jgi:hypothetical protein
VLIPLTNNWQVSSSLVTDSSWVNAVTLQAVEQQLNAKFCYKLGKTPTEIYELLQLSKETQP